MVVPFAAAGPGDIIARLVAEAMRRNLGQEIIVVNVGGAGGTIGTARVAQAKPDGYTILLGHVGQSTSTSLYKSLPYDPIDGFEAIGLVTDVPMTIVGKADLAPKDLKELVAYIRERPDQVNYAHSGLGSVAHLCGLDVHQRDQDESDRHPVQGRRRGHEGSAGGYDRRLLRAGDGHDGQHPGREDKALCGDDEEPGGSLALPFLQPRKRAFPRSASPPGMASMPPRHAGCRDQQTLDSASIGSHGRATSLPDSPSSAWSPSPRTRRRRPPWTQSSDRRRSTGLPFSRKPASSLNEPFPLSLTSL